MKKPLKELLEGSMEPGCLADKHGDCEFCEMTRRLHKLDERHYPTGSGHQGDTFKYCACGRPWLCPDRRILDGEK